MKWYQSNKILSVVLVLILGLVIYFGCKMIRTIGTSMGKESKSTGLLKDL